MPYVPSNGNLQKEILYAVAFMVLCGSVFGLYNRINAGKEQEWSSGTQRTEPLEILAVIPPKPRESLRKKLGKLINYDPNFSLALFEDFVYALYAKAHEARGEGKLQSLSAYVSQHAQSEFYPNYFEVRAVKGIVIGAMRIVEVESLVGAKPQVRVPIEIESNFTETIEQYGATQDRTIYALERWVLLRNRDTVSRTPENAQIFVCPNCGAPLSEQRDNICQYCQKIVDTGEFDWVVAEIEVLEREQRAPQLIANVEEVGTDFPTIEDPDTPSGIRAISFKDPSFSWPKLQSRISLIFDNLQVAWSNRDWMIARPYVTDNLFQMQLYWIETYKREKLRNVTEQARIAHIQCAAVYSDKFFDSITVRVYASSLDYTLSDDTGEVVCGSRVKPRNYTEYWTIIRSADHAGEPMLEKRCPNCGGELKINMAGSCEFCSAKVTAGQFDWVLSRIEQDESYQG
jgi:hypothetical protein